MSDSESDVIKYKEYEYVDPNTGKKSVIRRKWINTSKRNEKIAKLQEFLEENIEWIREKQPSSQKVCDKFNESYNDLKMSRSMTYKHYTKWCDVNNLSRHRRNNKKDV